MSSMITIGISDTKVVKGDKQLVTCALGSCVGTCLCDPLHKVGGLGHIMLPKYPAGNPKENKYRSTGTCITEMLWKMERLGASRAQLTAKIAGGAEMFEVSGDSVFGNISQRNVTAVRAMLAYKKIPIKAQDTDLSYDRTLYSTTDDGVATIKSFASGVKVY